MAIRLRHQNIAQLHDFAATTDGTAYIVMEYIDGVPLDLMLTATGPPSVDLALEVSRQALDALAYLHHQKFVHRDISPDNLMLAPGFDGSPVVKLIDLGIAKNLGSQSQLTQTGGLSRQGSLQLPRAVFWTGWATMSSTIEATSTRSACCSTNF